MEKQNFTSWLLEGGIVGIPKNLIGLMEPLRLTFEDLGKISYLLYCGCNQVQKEDSYAQNAVKSLRKKGLINWFPDCNRVDFSPMYDLISSKLGGSAVQIEREPENNEGTLTYSELIKSIERRLAHFLSAKEKIVIQKVTQSYDWSYELVLEMYTFYQANFRRRYAFSFFAQMAFGAKVEDLESLQRFIKDLNYTSYKVVEIKRRLGQKNNPTEVEKECYLKWANEWKFDHEMILMAVEQTIYASDPSFKYIDSILANWHEKDIKNTETLKQYQAKREKSKIKKNKGSVENDNNPIRDLDYLVE